MTTKNIPAQSGQRPYVCLLRLPEVLAVTGHKRSEWYRRIASGRAPAPVKLGERASAWVATEVQEYVAARIAERDAKAASESKILGATAKECAARVIETLT